MVPFINYVINLLYPKTCGICNKISKDILCKKCEVKLNKEIFLKIDSYNKNKLKYFTEHIYFTKYNGVIRYRIIDYKFHEKTYLNQFFSKIILKNEKIYVHLQKYDIIIPVPIHKNRKQKRGYNQSELIAKNIERKFGIKLFKNILLKTKNNAPQSILTKSKRKVNVKGAYKIRNNFSIKNKKVLLVDDVYTTGNTVNECAKILLEAGAKEVGVLTISKD